MPRTITLSGRRFLHPSEHPNYDPETGGYRGGSSDESPEEKDRLLREFFERLRANGHKPERSGEREGS